MKSLFGKHFFLNRVLFKLIVDIVAYFLWPAPSTFSFTMKLLALVWWSRLTKTKPDDGGVKQSTEILFVLLLSLLLLLLLNVSRISISRKRDISKKGLKLQLTLSNSNSKGPRILFESERDSNYRESFISVSNLKGPKSLLELERDSNYGGSN